MSESSRLIVETIVNGPFGENCYLAVDAGTRHALLIDPGDEENTILETVRRLGVEVQLIANTHAHIDHVGAVASLKRILGVPFAIHRAEEPWLAQLPAQAALFGLEPRDAPTVDRYLEDGDRITLGGLEAHVLYTPGHSAGGCCFHFAEDRVVFVGDTLFAQGIGRTDLPGGSTPRLLESIRKRLFTLPDDTQVHSGHGPSTEIGVERRTNPFLVEGGFPGF
jgi:hydroxyacylglutathione hydrolase